ncbi:MAG TPA: C40 family peptidase [Gaiella sp.]|nr:C40 family peptidase [Gaiella sp.]
MPSRLALLLAVAALGASVLATAARADHVGPSVSSLRLESPVHFVLPNPPPPSPTLAERAVALARTQLGVPYVYGGASPDGFDCSGLVMWVYGRLGITLPHNAAALFSVGRPVSLEHLRPGDLVFFPGLGHVGIYVGDGRMIHAPQTGEYVEIEALDERDGGLAGARRIA